MNKEIEQLLEERGDPKMVGSTEYHAIYETLQDAAESMEEGDDPYEMVIGICEEFKEVADSFIKLAKEKQAG